MNQLILGDNLEIMKKMDSESIDLIYLDPPFFSNRNYEVIWGDKGEIRSFEDRWSGGIDHYIAWLKERVEEMHRLLKPTGSIFLHCDWHADAYIRVYILDKLFGDNNFKGEIIWKRTFAHSDAKNKLSVLKDTIWYYSKSSKYTYNPIYSEYDEKYIKDFYSSEDKRGKYQAITLTGPKLNPNDIEWRGYHPKSSGRSWSIPKDIIAELTQNEKKLSQLERLELLYENDYIEFSKNGIPRVKKYLDKGKGVILGDVWTDINNVSAQSNERIGYPTQKPEALLDRIIRMCSNEGDIVLDPFVGGGTTAAVADKLNRKWIGIDQSVQAIKVSELRLNKQQNLFSDPFTVSLHKYDYDTLRYKDAFEFEKFIVEQFGGKPNIKQKGDFGIDGKTLDGTPIQVKRSDNIGRNVVDNFVSAAKRFDSKKFEENIKNKNSIGTIIAFSFGKGAIQEVARLKNDDGVILSLTKVEDIIPIAKKPKVTLIAEDLGSDKKGLREIEFIATGESDAGIEFFSWDFDFKNEKFNSSIMLDKEGKQKQKFKPGNYVIAVKVIDNEGLEEIQTIKLKINGEVKQV